MKPGSRVDIYTGINFVTVPVPEISSRSFIAFQQQLIKNGIEFSKAENPQNSFIITREQPYPLIITATSANNQVGQIVIIAPAPKNTNEVFIQESEAAVSAFETVWPFQKRQVIKVDATIRSLYETTSEHAFQELWEERLGQTVDSLAPFKRPIRGGGLRFVLDPQPNESAPIIEVKVESYLSDTRKIFVETQFNWLLPQNPGSPFQVREHLITIENYIENEVTNFLSGDRNAKK